MFADVVGSTQLIADLDPEQAMQRLEPAIAVMCAAVRRFEGTVVRVMGDGIFALFGAPRAQEGHALLACEAALAMQSDLPPGGLTLRVGLHSGGLVASVLASDPTKEQGAHGLTVHLASRMQQLAAPGSTYLSENCYRLIRPYCEVRSLGYHSLKGNPEPVEVYQLVGLKPAIASQQFRGTSLTELRGRDYELAALRRAFASSDSGDAKVIGISGPPGAGKSRLCYEFTEWCRSRLVRVLEARAQVFGHATPLQLILDFMRLLFQISPADDTMVARERIAQRVSALGPTFAADLPLLYDFLGITSDEDLPSNPNPKTRQARLLGILHHIVRQHGATTSVIVIEDLHWLDEASEDFIATLVEAVAGTRIMLMLNYRPSYTAFWMKSVYFEELPLAELSRAETDALVEGLVGQREELLEVRQRIAERSGGNPFFTEELVRSLVENLTIVGEAGDFRLGMKATESRLPATVEAVLGARIDRLGDEEKALLQIAAIIGKEFPLRVLQDVAGVMAAKSLPALDRLCDAGLMQDQGVSEGRQFAFRHPLIQEVAYASQLKARRVALHALVAQAMEAFYRHRLNEFAGLIAYHYDAAGQVEAAADYEARAAKWVGSTNPKQAIKHWQKVWSLLQNQPRSQKNDSLWIMAGGQVAWLGWREGVAADAAKPLIEQALVRARETDDSMIPMLLFVDGRITLASGGSADYYVDRVKEALSLLPPTRSGRIATLNCALSQAYGWAGLLEKALSANDIALRHVADVEDFDHQFLGYSVEHWIMSLRGRIFARLGDFSAAEKCFEELLAIEQTLLDPTVQFIPHLGYMDLAWCRRDAALARKHALRLAEIAQKSGSPYVRVYVFACAGTAKSLANDYVGAVQEFIAGLEYVRHAGASVGYEAELLASLADCYYRMEDFDHAIATARQAIETARKRCTRLPECRGLITLGAAQLASGVGSAEVQETFRCADNLIDATGARIYRPLLREEQARLPPLTVN